MKQSYVKRQGSPLVINTRSEEEYRQVLARRKKDRELQDLKTRVLSLEEEVALLKKKISGGNEGV